MGASSDGGQEPMDPGGVFRQLDDRSLYFGNAAEQRGLPLLGITDVESGVGGLGFEIAGPNHVGQ